MVLNTLLVILVCIIIVPVSSLILRFLIQIIKHRTQVNQLIIGAYFGLAFGLLWECYRILAFVFTGSVDVPFDQFAFAIKFALVLLAVYAIISLLSILSRHSGQEVKHQSFIKSFYFLAAIVFSTLNGFTYYPSELNEFGFYIYQVHPILAVIVLAFYIPGTIYVLFIGGLFIKKIKKKSFYRRMIVLAAVFGSLLVERYLHVIFYPLFSTYIGVIMDLVVMVIAAIGSFLLFKNISILEEISVYFCVRSIYLISKTGGQMIYGCDLQEVDAEDPLAPDRLLLGGFIFAVTQGLGNSLRTTKEIEIIKFGDITLLFKYTAYLFGVVLVSETVPLVHKKLGILVEKVEDHYKDALENWTGNLSQFKSEEINQWVIEIFR